VALCGKQKLHSFDIDIKMQLADRTIYPENIFAYNSKLTLLWGNMLPGFRHAGFLVS